MSAIPAAASPAFASPSALTALIIAVSNGTGEESASASSQYLRPVWGSPQDVRGSRPEQAHDLEPQVIHRLPILQALATALNTVAPLSDGADGHAEPPH